MTSLFRISLFFCLGVSSLYAETRPNILLIVADDLGYADVGFNGGKRFRTPNIDRLAETGINLKDFRACPMCSPTRAGLMTGRWPARFGMMRAVIPPWSTYGIPSDEDTIPELLATAGYERRGIAGKWHLGSARRSFLPNANGFTRFVGCYTGAIDYFTHVREGEVDWHHDSETKKEEGYATDLIGAEAVNFIRESPEGSPWFLYLPFNAPHSPFQAKDEDLERYPQMKNPDKRAYAAMVDCLDQNIGRVLREVESRADADNTLILFFSDNGGVLKAGSSNEPFRGEKLTVYEGGTRVCAAIRWPAGGLSGGKQFDGRVGYIDVLPTLLAAAEGPTPDDLDGINFLPALNGGAAIPERPWFSYMHQTKEAHASVHLGSWKLVVHGDAFSENPESPPTFELYDLANDFAETRDLAATGQERVKSLSKLLRSFGDLRSPGATSYSEGREGFVAPKDWIIEAP
jgi:arylsulfatase B